MTVLVRGGGASLANAFLTVLTKGVSPGPSPTFPFAWIPAPTLFSHRGCRRSGLGRPSSEPAPGGPCASPRRPPSRTSSGSPPCVLSFYQAKEQTPAVSSRRKPPPSRFGFKHEGPGGILLRFWSEDNDERGGQGDWRSPLPSDCLGQDAVGPQQVRDGSLTQGAGVPPCDSGSFVLCRPPAEPPDAPSAPGLSVRDKGV